MFGKSPNENYQMNQCWAIIKKNCPMHNAIYNLVLCVGQSTNFDYLRKRALNQNNIRRHLFLRQGATIMFNPNMLAKFRCVCKRWRYAWDKAFPPKNEHCILSDSNFKQIRLITYLPSTMLKYMYLALIGTTF